VWQIYQYGSLNTEGYAYGPNNERVEKVITANGVSNYYTYLYGVDGCRLGVYQPDIDGSGRLYFRGGSAITPCFGGRMLYTRGNQLAVADRLGSIRPLNGSQTATTSYYPYGEEQPQQASEDTERFATYYRDSTNLDYAKNRYYTNQFGRFLTPDPSTGVNLGDPRTWNKYTYVGGDPVNYNDPSGEMMAVVCGFQDCGGGTFGPLIGPFDWYFGAGNSGSEPYLGPLGPRPGGGGGGFIHVTNPSKAGPNQGRIRNGMTWIEQNVDDNCAGWLTGVGDAIAGLLGNPEDERTVIIGHGAFDTRKTAAVTNNNPNQTDLPAGYGMAVNDLGAFFVGSYTENGRTYSLSANGYVGGTSQAQVAILLHELGHMLNAQGFQSDFNNDQAGAANDRLVRQHCQRTLDAARNIH